MRARPLIAIAALVVSFAPSIAHAEEPSWFVPEGTRPKVMALEINPLGILIGRFGANIEYMLAAHHAVILSPHYYYALPGVSDQLDGPGVEAGYRYYTGTGGPVGWFLGASASFATYRYLHTATTQLRDSDNLQLDAPVHNTWESIGGAVDAGYQVIVQEHVIIGGGLGVEYKYYTSGPGFEYLSHPYHDLVYGPGIRPRVLLAAGGTF